MSDLKAKVKRVIEKTIMMELMMVMTLEKDSPPGEAVRGHNANVERATNRITDLFYAETITEEKI